MKQITLPFLFAFIMPLTLFPQWTNRYPKVEGLSHHVYLEGFELPILNAGPMDPAPSPNGNEVAFAARGWLWLLNMESGTAKRITKRAAMDSRPEWSPDGNQIVFVRDDGRDTRIILLDLESEKERILADEDAIDLDPYFSPNGKYIYYASAVRGPLDIWQIDPDTGEKKRLTGDRGMERRPIALPSGDYLIYLNKMGRKSGSYNSIELFDLDSGYATPLVEYHIASQSDMTISPDGFYMAYTWPHEGGYELRVMDIATPNTSVLLTRSQGLPLAPAFSHDGQWVYYAEADESEQMVMKRISIYGGQPQNVEVNQWNWGTGTGKLKIKSKVDGEIAPVRLNILDADGHPVIPEAGIVRFDGQNGRVFFYSPGEIEVIGTPGEWTVSSVQGFTTPEISRKATIEANKTTALTLDLQQVWNPKNNGWYSGDNHFHLNYGGTYRLDPEDIILDAGGEGLDVMFPLLANLHNRFLQQELRGWKHAGPPIISFGQEVRSHFLGHVALIGARDLFWPWIWGPYYQVYSRDDRPNAAALRFARAQGGLGGYVHPVVIRDPFAGDGARSVPINLVADAVLGETDLIEVACLWTDEIGTGTLWHKILSLGISVTPSAGSDVMNDYYHTMAVGATRVYVKPEGPLTIESYLRALKEGKSFVSNGPLIEFTVEGKEPGQVINSDGEKAKWNLQVHTAVPVDTIEILVNGKIIWRNKSGAKAGSKTYRGAIAVPPGGWVAARVYGGTTKWPFMDSYPFAESSPVWFNKVGSTDPSAAKQAARDLLQVLDVSEQRLKKGYGKAPIPNLRRHFAEARKKLKEITE